MEALDILTTKLNSLKSQIDSIESMGNTPAILLDSSIDRFAYRNGKFVIVGLEPQHIRYKMGTIFVLTPEGMEDWDMYVDKNYVLRFVEITHNVLIRLLR